MNHTIRPTLFVQCKRRMLMPAFGLLLVLGIALFNCLAAADDDVSGWSSGFTHPLHGGDHLLTMLAVGIWAAQLRGQAIWMLPLTFVGVMSLGGLAGAAGLLIPGAEAVIVLSCLVFMVLITRKIRFSSQINVLIVAFFAFFHGFAHGQEISTSANLISYTLGFMVATLLLHGAGILAVRVLLVIFALFLSHLVYAQPVTNSATVKLTIPAQTGIPYERIITARPEPPDSRHIRQLFHSGEDGWHHTAMQHQTSYKPITGSVRKLVRVIFSSGLSIADKLATANLPAIHQLGIHFLTSGVGVTSPPVASVFNEKPRFGPTAVFFAPIPVNSTSLFFGTTRYSELHHTFFTLATSFLTNGVGATSPPQFHASSFVTPLNFNELAFGNSTPLKSAIPLHPTISFTLFSCLHNVPRRDLSHACMPMPCCFRSTGRVGHHAPQII